MISHILAYMKEKKSFMSVLNGLNYKYLMIVYKNTYEMTYPRRIDLSVLENFHVEYENLYKMAVERFFLSDKSIKDIATRISVIESKCRLLGSKKFNIEFIRWNTKRKLIAYLNEQNLIKKEFENLYNKQVNLSESFYYDKDLLKSHISLWENLFNKSINFLLSREITMADNFIKILKEQMEHINKVRPQLRITRRR